MGTRNQQAVVIGAGIGGLTAGALLAKRGFDVFVLEQAIIPGGCASTFKRRGFTFDVGATQVAGLEPGGVHYKIFEELGVELPESTPCDPACAVYLPNESEPISVWRNPAQWKQERSQKFPGSEPFWEKMDELFEISWRFNSRDPILPPTDFRDLLTLGTKLRPETLSTIPYTWRTVADVLKDYDLHKNKKLRRFLDMQLKLYSQVEADETAVLYAAVALGLSTEPQGLYHLQGSMQVLADRLVEGLSKYGGRLLVQQQVQLILRENGKVVGVQVFDKRKEQVWQVRADQIFANVTPDALSQMLDGEGDERPFRKLARLDKLPEPSGAFVIYLGVDRAAIPEDCPPHLQFIYDFDGPIGENNSLFVSVSKPGDGRAPEGKATIIASSFTDAKGWWQMAKEEYESMKKRYTEEAIDRLAGFFPNLREHILHVESATPRTFHQFTARPLGGVGGLGQRPAQFGPFSFSNRTPYANLWLVGDSTYPGEGTAGVSYSALNALTLMEKSL